VTQPHTSPWIMCFKPNPQARLRLFCFPYAGGGASLFRPWSDLLPTSIEICAIQPPGRENRFREARFTHLPELVTALDTAIDPWVQSLPFAFFGHSLGALTSFELTRTLYRRHGPMPMHLMVASHRAPQLPERHLRLSDLPDAIFLQELRRLNGTANDVAENSDLMEVLMPLLRADFAVAESYTYQQETPLPCPIAAIGGSADADVGKEELAAWQTETTGPFSLHLLEGDHFFLTTHRSALFQVITDHVGI